MNIPCKLDRYCPCLNDAIRKYGGLSQIVKSKNGEAIFVGIINSICGQCSGGACSGWMQEFRRRCRLDFLHFEAAHECEEGSAEHAFIQKMRQHPSLFPIKL